MMYQAVRQRLNQTGSQPHRGLQETVDDTPTTKGTGPQQESREEADGRNDHRPPFPTQAWKPTVVLSKINRYRLGRGDAPSEVSS